MASQEKYTPKLCTAGDSIPFKSAEEAWFWFIQAQQARTDGARIKAGSGAMARPCEPVDILRVLDRLYRQRRLLRDHLLVLRHYGRRQMAPDKRRIKEARAYKIWCEALERMEPCLQRKGIVQAFRPVPDENWQRTAVVLEGTVPG